MLMIRLWSCEHSVSELVCPLYPLFSRRKEAGSWGLGINLFLLLFLQATSLPRTNDLMVIGCDPRKKRKKKLVPPPRAPDPPLVSAEAGAAAASLGGQCNKRTKRKEIHQ